MTELHVSTYSRSSSDTQLVLKINWRRNIHYVNPQNSVEIIKIIENVNVFNMNNVCVCE